MKTFAKKIFLTLAVLMIVSAVSGCALVDKDTSIMSPAMWNTIFRNRENMKKLRKGMTKDEVKAIMGEPMTGEVYCEENIWWYYIRTRWSDGRATRDECAPVVFDETGRVEGWGVNFYRDRYSFTGWTEQGVIQVLK